MPTIAVLDEAVANKIAAGEVVERPASVVKELVENAIDAGARRVFVELMGAGRDLIRVVDDGAGMSPEDAPLAILPHATSKIRTVVDLAAISTFGFRGEALPSIAAVSHLVLITRQRGQDSGTMVATEGGAAPRVEPVGCPEGTSAAVRHLFFNTPARLKFLKHNKTELARIVESASCFALAFPDLGIVVTNEGKEVFRADPAGELLPRAADVLGRDAAAALIPFATDQPFAAASGLISDLTLHRPTRSGQFIFVNRRPVRCPVIAQAITRAYEGLLPAGRHPIACVFLEIDPRLVDANVHPTKQEVRFPRDNDVFEVVYSAIRDGLLAADLVPRATGSAPAEPLSLERPTPAPSRTADRQHALDLSHRREPAGAASTAAFEAALARRIRADEASPVPPPPDAGVEGSAPTGRPRDEANLPSARVIGQALDSYILAEAGGELLLIDQHAAHERVLYERFVRSAEGDQTHTQRLLAPVTVHLSAPEAALVIENLDAFAAVGLELEAFGGGSFIVRSVPTAAGCGAPERAAEALLRGVLADLASPDSEFASVRDMRARICATAACKAAVKQGDRLANTEMEALLRDLAAADVRFTCPHARPAVVRLAGDALERYFHRR